jgi:glycerol-3-phosphate dehydrogenase
MSASEPIHDVVVVGAGVVGCAIARALAPYVLDVVVLERASDLCEGTSKANTAVLHTGFDCAPGSLESQLVAAGGAELRDYAERCGIALEPVGALLVAWDVEQLAALPGIVAKAEANGYLGCRVLAAEEVYAAEPALGAGALGGIVVPDEAIIDPWSVPLAFALEAASAGVEFRFGASLLSLQRAGGTYALETSLGTVRSRWLVNAAGLSSAEVDGMCSHHDFRVVPRRGELLVFDKLARGLVTSVILPVPSARTKGMLVSPTVFGNLLVGPTADDIEDPTATATTQDGIDRLVAGARRLVPALAGEEVTASYAGIRAATEHSDYQIRAHRGEGSVCVGGIRSTGLTAAPAIARHVLGLLEAEGLDLEERPAPPVEPRLAPLGEAQLRPYLDAARIEQDPAYGEIVCHCERVTRGELRDAVAGPLPARDLGGLRRRTRAMNGRCQGFYCGAAVLQALAALTGTAPERLVGLES